MTFLETPQPKSKKMKIIAAGAVAATVLLVFFGFSGNEKTSDGTEFAVASRELIEIGGIDHGISLDGSCVRAYLLHMTGVQNGRRHFTATIDLRGNPENDVQLFNLLATPSCKDDVSKAIAGITERMPENTKQDSDVLIYSYRSSSGTRFLP